MLGPVNESKITRRPLRSRGTAWAGGVSRGMLRMGFRPNGVSLIGIFFAGGAGAAIGFAAESGMPWMLWLLAAAGVQLRLLCNLMDGLLAVEGGLKSATGEMFNELPDRIEDAWILVPLGYAGGTDWSVALGWSAACGAVGTAYIRAMGAGLTGSHDFRGPMAKPHRMAAVTVLCLVMVGRDLANQAWPVLLWGLAAINAGIAITCWRRIRNLATILKSPTTPP